MAYFETNPLKSAGLRFGKVAIAGALLLVFQVALAVLQVMQTDPNFLIYGAEVTLFIAVVLAIQKYLKEKAK